MSYYRGGGIHFAPPAPNPYAGLLGAIGMIMGNNAADREQGKMNTGLLNFSESLNNTPGYSTTTVDGQPAFGDIKLNPTMGQYKPAVGDVQLLPSMNEHKPVSANDLIGDIKFDTSAQMTGADRAKPADAKQPAEAPAESRFQTTTKSFTDVQREYMKNAYAKMKEMQGTMGAQAFAKIQPQLMAQVKDGLGTLKADYDKQMEGSAIDAVGNATTPEMQKKALLSYAKQTGKSPDWIRGIVGTNIKQMDDGANIHWFRTDNMGNPLDVDEKGMPRAYHSIPKLLSPHDVQQGELTREGHAIQREGIAARGSGGANAEGRYIDVPNFGKMTPMQVLSAYKDAMGGNVKTTDSYGNEKIVAKPANPDILRILGPVVKKVRGEMGLPQIVDNTGDPAIDQKIANMRANGADEKLINDMVWEEQNKPKTQGATPGMGWDEATSNVVY